MTQHKHQPLPIGQLAHGRLQPATTLVLQHLVLGARPAGRQVLRRIPFHAIRIDRGPRNPSFPPAPGLQPIETPVNEDPREPYLKGEILAERPHMRVGLHKRILYGLIGVGRIAQVMKRNASRAALMALDKSRIGLTRLVQLPGGLEGFYANGDGGVGFSAGF